MCKRHLKPLVEAFLNMLFVIAMEGLNRLIKTADAESLLHPLGHHGIKDRAFFYADDVVLFLRSKQQDLVMAKVILDIFGSASRLYVNPDKCLMSPIQCGLEETVNLMCFSLVAYNLSPANTSACRFRPPT
jgi:hypothetical protein